MKKLILSVFAVFLLSGTAMAGQWVFNDFDMDKLRAYNYTTAYTFTGPDKPLLIGATTDPLFAYEDDSIPTISFFSIGGCFGAKTEGTAQQNLYGCADFIKFKWLGIGGNVNLTNTGDGLFKTGGLHFRLGGEF